MNKRLCTILSIVTPILILGRIIIRALSNTPTWDSIMDVGSAPAMNQGINKTSTSLADINFDPNLLIILGIIIGIIVIAVIIIMLIVLIYTIIKAYAKIERKDNI